MESKVLYEHIQFNVDSFLQVLSDSLVMVSGDSNPPSTCFDVKCLNRLTGLNQIVDVFANSNVIFDWCLVYECEGSCLSANLLASN